MDEKNPDKPPFKTTMKSFNILNNKRKASKYKEKFFVVIDDPKLPNILIHPSGKYDLNIIKEARGIEEEPTLKPSEVKESSERTIEKPEAKEKRTYKRKN